MQNYLNDTEFATSSLFEILINDGKELSRLQAEVTSLNHQYPVFQEEFFSYEKREDYDEQQLQHRFVMMARTKEKITKVESQISKLEEEIRNKEISYQSISMSILQIAKQGLSIVHGNFSAIPPGKTVKSQSSRDIIWQARNQSIHYEEGNYRKPVMDCFSLLENDFGPEYSLSTYRHTNHAAKVLNNVLEWQTYDDYKKDMLLLK